MRTDQQVHAAVRQAFDPDDLRQRADVMRHRDPGLAALPDGDHAEAVPFLQALGDHLPVTRLEDVQRQRHVRKEHHFQGKERQPLGHDFSI